MARVKKETTKTISKFEAVALNELEKTDIDRELERIRQFNKFSLNECKRTINEINSDIDKLSIKKEIALNELSLTKEMAEKARFTVQIDFAKYIEVLNEQEKLVQKSKIVVDSLDSEIASMKVQLTKFKSVLKDLNTKVNS